MTQRTLHYKAAGVDIDRGKQLIERIKPLAKPSRRTEVIGGIGGFAGLFAVPQGYQEPVLVASTDGVCTKLKLAIEMRQHSTIGLDLVAMCVNDLLVQGAQPLFFLDYYATGKLELSVATEVIKGISAGCLQANMTLLGGETAEMPDMYRGEEYDLAGFCLGIVEKSRIIDSRRVQTGDVLIGVAASGPHANGYSLIRKILTTKQADLNQRMAQRTLGACLLEPTKIYARCLQPLFDQFDLHALAHITGGGITENVPRVLPSHLQAVIHTHSWTWPAIFTWLQKQGNVLTDEMYRTFNCGLGMIMCLPAQQAQACLATIHSSGEQAWEIGYIRAKTGHESVVRIASSP